LLSLDVRDLSFWFREATALNMTRQAATMLITRVAVWADEHHGREFVNELLDGASRARNGITQEQVNVDSWEHLKAIKGA